MTSPRLPTFFISHGGGPWPFMKDQTRGAYDRLEASLQDMARLVGADLAAVLVISGHWVSGDFTVMNGPHPSMIYDYMGFPEHTYRIRYPAPGSPPVAARVQSLMEGVGLTVRMDAQRGFDHGTFVPLAVMYPQAQVPVVQLSIKHGFDPAEHLAAGRALAPLRDENVLILGSGLSYHNLRAFGPMARDASQAFDRWLQDTLVEADPLERTTALIDWAQAPAARQAHPHEDHLLPLMVAVGAAEHEAGRCIYHEDDFMGGVSVSSFQFG